MDEKRVQEEFFRDVRCCACGARNGVYVQKDESGYWHVCDDCDLPVFGSYVRYGTEPHRHIDENYDED